MKLLPKTLATCLLIAAFPIVVNGQPYTLPANTPECVKTKLDALGKSVIENAVACYNECKDAEMPDAKTLFESLDEDNLKTCSGFQTQVMDAVCKTNIVKCCPWAVPQFIDLMTCVAEDGLEATPAPCELTCSARRRELRSRDLRGRELFIDVGDGSVVEPLGTRYVDDCSNHLDPNGTGQAPTADEMATIMANGDYLSCLATTTVTIVGEKVAYEEYKEKTVIDMEWEIPSVGLNLGTAIGILLAVCGCFGLCCSGYCYKKSSSPKELKEEDE